MLSSCPVGVGREVIQMVEVVGQLSAAKGRHISEAFFPSVPRQRPSSKKPYFMFLSFFLFFFFLNLNFGRYCFVFEFSVGLFVPDQWFWRLLGICDSQCEHLLPRIPRGTGKIGAVMYKLYISPQFRAKRDYYIA